MPYIEVDLRELECLALLLACEERISRRSSQRMLVWTWKVLTGPDRGTNVKSYTSLEPHALRSLKQHLLAFGFAGEVDIDTATLIGVKVRLLIDNRNRLRPSVKRIWAVRKQQLAEIKAR
jgi:hypothetical protein